MCNPFTPVVDCQKRGEWGSSEGVWPQRTATTRAHTWEAERSLSAVTQGWAGTSPWGSVSEERPVGSARAGSKGPSGLMEEAVS